MIKNLNETLSLITLTVLVFVSVKIGLGLIFSSHLNGSARGNFTLLKEYSENTEE